MPAGSHEGASGVLTFLMTDVEGSTQLWQQDEVGMRSALARHDEIVTGAIAGHGGRLVKERGEGDSTFSVFTSARGAVLAAVSLQQALLDETWADGTALRTRAALHSGECQERDGDYFGPVVNRCARLRGIAHGGQILCSQTTADLVVDVLPAGTALRHLGSHGLRDLARPEEVYEVLHDRAPAGLPPLRSLGPARTNLPDPRTPFIGRSRELDEVRRHLDANRLVTLTGVGGCGKTRLAIAVAAGIAAQGSTTCFCDLSTVADPSSVVAALGEATGLGTGGAAVPALRPLRDELLDHLASSPQLLVLDNCEHLLDVCASLVDELLEHAPDLRVLATSREALEVPGERTYRVPSLSVPGPGETGGEAVELFCTRATAVDAGFRLTPGAADHVAEICRRLDGIPLAIELAASQAAALTPQQISERLADRFRLLSGGRRRVQRQQTLAAALDWSYDLLDADEQALLRALAVFPQPFTLDQVEAIWSRPDRPVATVLRRLVAASLVGTTADRFRLLETVRLYAEHKLVEAGEASDLRTTHRDMVLSWLATIPDEVLFSGAGAAETISEIDHIRAAIRWCAQQGDAGPLAQIAGRCVPAFAADVSELRPALDASAAVVELSPDDRLRVLVARQWSAVIAQDPAQLAAASTELPTLTGPHRSPLLAVAHSLAATHHGTLHYALRDQASRDAALLHSAHARELAPGQGTEAFASIWLGLALVGLGDLPAAKDAFHAVANGPREVDAITGAGHGMLAATAEMLGSELEARAGWTASRRIFTADPWGAATGWDVFWLAAATGGLVTVDDPSDGHATLTELLDRTEERRLSGVIVRMVLASIGVVAAHRGAPAWTVRLLTPNLDAPYTTLDHLYLTWYLDRVLPALGPGAVDELRAEARSTPLFEMARAALAEIAP